MLRSSVFRINLRFALAHMVPRGVVREISKAASNGEIGRSAQRRCIGLRAPRFSRFDMPMTTLAALPANRAMGQGTESAAGDPAPRNVVASRWGRRGSGEPRLGPTRLEALLATRLAQPAASVIASYDGQPLAGLAVGPWPFSWWRIRARAAVIARTLALRSSGTRRPGPKTFSRGPMPRCDLERAGGAFALCGLGGPARFCLACLALASAAAKVSAAAWAASLVPFLTRAAPGAKRREARPVNDCESKLGS